MNQNALFLPVNDRLGHTRLLPLGGDYVTNLTDVVKHTDPGLTIDITFAGQVPNAIPEAIRSGVNGEFSQSDLRKLKTVLVFQNAMGVTQMLNVMAGALPE